MSLEVNIEKRGAGFYEVSLNGRLDTSTYIPCEENLNMLLNSSTKILMFNMKHLSYISSMGLRVLFIARKTISEHGGKFFMTNLQPQVAKVFEIAHVLPKDSVFESIEEADRYFDNMQKQEIEKQENKKKDLYSE
ncbi:MAG: STAS domain-containing protein [Candidatus Theseobacter exili]|nr:STAS domain-containing protein [Candidatus Theseobacter exili]